MLYINELKERIKIIKEKGWIPCGHSNYGDAGLKLERMLNINSGDFEIPDYNNIEIKTKKSIFHKTITLFSATPDSYLFEIKRLHRMYGYPERKNNTYKVLNKSVFCKKYTYIYNGIYFSLNVNYEEEKIELLICDKNLNIIDKYTSWSFSLLKEKLERKLKYLCYVTIDTYYSHSQLYVKYKNDRYFQLKNFFVFLKLIEDGKISITFRIGVFKSGKRKGQIHDHGTEFGIDETDLQLLFDEI